MVSSGEHLGLGEAKMLSLIHPGVVEAVFNLQCGCGFPHLVLDPLRWRRFQ